MPPLRPPTSVPMFRLFRPIRATGRFSSRALSSCHRATRPITNSPRQGIALPRHAQPTIITNKIRTLATTSSGKSQGDEMVEELQELCVRLAPVSPSSCVARKRGKHCVNHDGTVMKPPKTNSKSPPKAPMAPPSTPRRTASLRATPSTSCWRCTRCIRRILLPRRGRRSPSRMTGARLWRRILIRRRSLRRCVTR